MIKGCVVILLQSTVMHFQKLEGNICHVGFGPRDSHKTPWKLPIPQFDETDPMHVSISEAGVRAAEGRLSGLVNCMKSVTG